MTASRVRRAVQLLEARGFSPARTTPVVPSLEDVFIHSIETADAGGENSQ